MSLLTLILKSKYLVNCSKITKPPTMADAVTNVDAMGGVLTPHALLPVSNRGWDVALSLRIVELKWIEYKWIEMTTKVREKKKEDDQQLWLVESNKTMWRAMTKRTTSAIPGKGAVYFEIMNAKGLVLRVFKDTVNEWKRGRVLLSVYSILCFL